MTRIILAALTFSFSLLLNSNAQEKKEPPSRPVQIDKKEDNRDPREAKLPKIELPEFVITGREIIDLPMTRKLTPGDSLSSLVDASRLSGLGEKGGSEQPSGKSTAGLLESPESYDGKLNLGYGRFNSRYGEGWFGKKYTEGDFSLHGRYLAHRAYVPHANASEGGVDAAGGIYLPRNSAVFAGTRLFGTAAYDGKKYRFFGTPTPSDERLVSIYGVGAGLSSPAGAGVSYEASMKIRRLTIEDRDKSQEDELTFSVLAAHQFPEFYLKGDMLYGGSFLTQSISGKDPQYYRGSVGVRKLFFEKFDVSAGVGLFLYRNFDSGSKSKFYPSLSLQYYVRQGLTLFAQVDPSVERNSLGRAVAENRYIGNDVRIHHQDIFVNLSGGLQFETSKRGSGRVYFKYQRVRDFPAYVDPSTLAYIQIVPVPYRDWDLSYSGITRFLSFNGELFVHVTDADRLSGAISLLSSENSSTKKQVPYLPSVQITSDYSHQFPFGLTTRISGRFVGRRSIDLSELEHLNSFFLLGASAEYRIAKNFGVFFQLNNIFDEHYSLWSRYQEIPFSAMGGITARW